MNRQDLYLYEVERQSLLMAFEEKAVTIQAALDLALEAIDNSFRVKSRELNDQWDSERRALARSAQEQHRALRTERWTVIAKYAREWAEKER